MNLLSSLFGNFEIEEIEDFKIAKNERGKFSSNFTNKHMIPG